VPARFAAHVRAAGGDRRALYAEFLGDPRSGPTEVRFVVVDRDGEILLTDRQTPADAAFRSTAAKDPDPLGCSELVAARLFELAGWQAVPGGARDGRFAARWQEKSGSPDARERAAMQQRLAALRAGLAAATFEALPPVGDADHAAAAQRFAKELQQALRCKSVSAAETELAVAPNSNQQKRLWDLARAAKKAIAGRAPAADYVVAVDAAVGGSGRGYANVVVLTGAGEVVLADFQNDQHPLFQQRRPETHADAEALAVARLAALLR
jgi:hypothetical protein